MILQSIWFILVFVLIGGYAMLDGFDLGVGVLHLFHRDNATRRVYLNAIAPLWDGNEVWLLTAGGALFAAFPPVYATVFSGFYIALMLVLAGLIFRAVSIEFRGKVESARWRSVWDIAFGSSSLLLCILFGVAFGNVLRGIEIGAEDGNFYHAGGFLDLLNPYSIAVGLLTVIVFVMHGAIYLSGKTDSTARERVVKVAQIFWVLVVVMLVVVALLTALLAPSLIRTGAGTWILWPIVGALLASLATIVPSLKTGSHSRAFAASSVSIVAMVALGAVGLFPRLLPASNDPGLSLTIYNSSSSQLTLKTMLVIALAGMPLVIGYSILIHRIFRGKVVITADSY